LNTYRVTETTLDCTYRLVTFDHVLSSHSFSSDIPIRLPLPNEISYLNIVEKEKEKDGDIDDLYICVVGVFNGYLNESEKEIGNHLIEIDGEMYYKTGDLFQISNDEFYPKGRRDFQVKI
jgi:hypothetical protein